MKVGSVPMTPKPLGTSIRIFLADGGADGVWVVEKSNWTGKALMAPRTRFGDLRARSDLDGPGVYLLIGPTESGLLANRVYIGETDDLPGRLDSHNKNKEFWNRAIVFTSKDANLNKAHIRYLEARLIGLATVAKRRVGQREPRFVAAIVRARHCGSGGVPCGDAPDLPGPWGAGVPEGRGATLQFRAPQAGWEGHEGRGHGDR